MNGIFIIAHAPLASALRQCALHVFPDCAAGVIALDVQPNMSPEETLAQARILFGELGTPNALVMVDVFGATPCNVAQRLADGVLVKVVAGVNVPMLWRSLCYVGDSLEALAARAIAGATQGVMQVATSKPQNQTQKPGANDQSHAQHQQ